MPRLAASLILLAISTVTPSIEASDESDLIQDGDYIVVKGRIHICPFFKEYVTGYARVENSNVTLFGHVISAVGLTPQQFQIALTEAIGKETGRKPESIVIEVISNSEFHLRQAELDQDINSFHRAIASCEREKRLNEQSSGEAEVSF